MATQPPVEPSQTLANSDVAPQEAAPEVKRRISVGNTFAAMKYRDFVWLWLGQITHSSALWMEMLATPILVLQLTGSPAQLGLILGFRGMVSMAMGPVGGVVADMFKRKHVLIATKFPVMATAVIYALLIWLGLIEMWHLYAFTLFRGVTMAFDQPARNAMIPTIVPAHLVTNAVALSSGSQQSVRIGGPAAGGIIIATLGLPAAFMTVAFIYVLALFFTVMLRVPDHRRPGSRVHITHAGSDFIEGLRFAWKTPGVFGILVIAVVYHAFGVNYLQIFGSIYAIKVMDIGPTGLGWLISMSGVGGIVGALSLATVSPSRRRGLIIMSVMVSFSVVLILYATGAYIGSVPMLYSMAVLLGLHQSWILPLMHATLLSASPEEMRGRIFSLLSLDRGVSALGGMAAGLLAAVFFPPLAQMILAVAGLVIVLVMLIGFRNLRRIQ